MAAKTLSYVTLDVFTTSTFEGNPLAVVHVPATLSSALTQDTKQLIAREFNYSETVFLHLPSSPPPTDDSTPEYKIDIFLTDAEVPLAGHPVIGTAVHVFTSLLPSTTSTGSSPNAAPQTRARFQTKAGPVALSFTPRTASVTAAIPHNIHLHTNPIFSVSDLLAQQPGLASSRSDPASGGEGWEIDVLSIVRGMAFVYVRLASLEELGAARLFSPRLDAGKLDAGWEGGVLMVMFYVLLPPGSAETSSSTGAGDARSLAAAEVKLRTRMIEGVFEDPATGSASCGLAALLAMKEGLGKIGSGRRRFGMTQAVEMGRRSEIGVEVDVEGGEIGEIKLVGTAVEVMKGEVRYA